MLDQSRRVVLGQRRREAGGIVVAFARREVHFDEAEKLRGLGEEASVVGSDVGGEGLHVAVQGGDVVDHDVDLRA